MYPELFLAVLPLAVVSRASSRNVSLKGTMQDGTWGVSMNMLPSKVSQLQLCCQAAGNGSALCCMCHAQAPV
jgi:hypothetical protein